MKKITFLRTLLLAIILLMGNAFVQAQYTGAGTFTKIKSLADLTDGYYVVANVFGEFAMKSTNAGSFFTHTAITPVADVITNPEKAIVWKIETNGDGRTIYSEETAKYVSYTGTSNAAQAVAAVTANNQRWTFTELEGDFTVANLGITTRFLKYNSSAPRFACYTSGQQNLLLYKMGEASLDPTIIVTPTTLSGFGYEFGTSSSVEKTFIVSGINLTADITLTAPTNYELSKTAGVDYASELTYTQTAGEVTETTVYVRLKTGLVIGDYNGEEILLTSTDATDATLTCSGTVTTPPAPTAPIATAATDVIQTGFTANWETSATATEYELDVYTKTGSKLTILSENFNGFAEGTTGAGANSTDKSATLDDFTETTGWTGSKVYQAGGTAKMGGSSALGYLVTPIIDLSAFSGEFNLSFDAMAWSGDATSFKIYLDDALVHTVTDLNNTDYTLSSYTVDLTGGNATSSIKFEGKVASKGRFFLDNIVITQGDETLTQVIGSPFTVSGDNSKAVSDLSPATDYYYTVKATNVYGASEKSNEIHVKTCKTVITPAAHATDFWAVENGRNAIILAWTDAAVADGYLIKGSVVSFEDIVAPTNGIAESDAALVLNVVQGEQIIEMTGLTENTTYFFKIYPYNGTSDAILYKTDGAVPEVSATTEAITTPVAHATEFEGITGTVGTSQIDLIWTDAAVADGYLIKASTVSFDAIVPPTNGVAETDAPLVKNVAQGEEVAEFIELSENTIYYFKLFPYNGSGAAILYKTDGLVPEVSVKTDKNGEPVAIDQVTSKLTIYANNGRIYGAENARIYTILGMNVTKQNGNLKGIYLVKANGNTQKIVVN